MRATWVLILSWVIISSAIWISPHSNELVKLLGYSTENISKGYFWTPITSIFIHANITHLLMNAIAFFFFGIAIEKEAGKKKMLAIFFIGALSGDLLSSLFYGFHDISVGASGGVSAVLGAAILVAPFRFSLFPYVFPAPIVVVGLIYIASNILGLFSNAVSNVSYAAHIGGLMLGMSYGFSKVGTIKGVLTMITGFLLIVGTAFILTLF